MCIFADAPKKPKAEDLLKKVQKTESKLSNLEARGKLAEAEGLVQEQKWSSALKRASGEKIRDDPNLLKKTIKKQEKKKQVRKLLHSAFVAFPPFHLLFH